jgi:hypothetical protein
MDTQVDVYLSFPADEEIEERYNELHKYLGSVEAIEIAFEIEFSCGDGKFLSNDSDFADDEELGKYDGNVCLESLPKSHITGKLLKANKPYRFTVKYSETSEEEVYYFNSKEVNRKWVG